MTKIFDLQKVFHPFGGTISTRFTEIQIEHSDLKQTGVVRASEKDRQTTLLSFDRAVHDSDGFGKIVFKAGSDRMISKSSFFEVKRGVFIADDDDFKFGAKVDGFEDVADIKLDIQNTVDVTQKGRQSIVVKQNFSREYHIPLPPFCKLLAGVVGYNTELSADFSGHVTINGVLRGTNECSVAMLVYIYFLDNPGEVLENTVPGMPRPGRSDGGNIIDIRQAFEAHIKTKDYGTIFFSNPANAAMSGGTIGRECKVTFEAKGTLGTFAVSEYNLITKQYKVDEKMPDTADEILKTLLNI